MDNVNPNVYNDNKQVLASLFSESEQSSFTEVDNS